jgi:hypothetical protein
MKKSIVSMLAVGALALFLLTGLADQPDKEKGPKKGPPPDKKGWEPGKIIPPYVRDALEFTEDQQKKIDALEKEVRTKLLKIFTEDQKKRLKELNEKGPKGPGEDGPPKKGKDKDKDQEERYGREEVRLIAPPSLEKVQRLASLANGVNIFLGPRQRA